MWRRIKNLWGWSNLEPKPMITQASEPSGYLRPRGDGTNEYIPAKRMATIIDMSKKDDEIPTAE